MEGIYVLVKVTGLMVVGAIALAALAAFGLYELYTMLRNMIRGAA